MALEQDLLVGLSVTILKGTEPYDNCDQWYHGNYCNYQNSSERSMVMTCDNVLLFC